jgi:hypothetical protein
VIGIVFASIGGLIGLALLVGGIAVLAAYAFGRDDDGYFSSDRQRLESATYAIITEDIDLGVDEVDWAPDKILGNVRVQVESAKPMFVGIASDDDVDRYLTTSLTTSWSTSTATTPSSTDTRGARRGRHRAFKTSGSGSPRAPASRRSRGMPSSVAGARS